MAPPALLRSAILCVAVLLGTSTTAYAQPKSRVVHVFVALADNEHQGIIPVPKTLGNGDDPSRNLYWGAAYGVRTCFKKDPSWTESEFSTNVNLHVLERSIFKNKTSGTVLVADAYRGSDIKQALTDFFQAAAGIVNKQTALEGGGAAVPATADLVVYVGHDGLMDFQVTMDYGGHSGAGKPAIVLACASKSFFRDNLRASGAEPLLWTTGLLAPEAYTLKAAVEAWMEGKPAEEVRQRAAAAYAKYQKISDRAALRLFSTDW